jgi:hypothetical protein
VEGLRTQSRLEQGAALFTLRATRLLLDERQLMLLFLFDTIKNGVPLSTPSVRESAKTIRKRLPRFTAVSSIIPIPTLVSSHRAIPQKMAPRRHPPNEPLRKPLSGAGKNGWSKATTRQEYTKENPQQRRKSLEGIEKLREREREKELEI